MVDKKPKTASDAKKRKTANPKAVKPKAVKPKPKAAKPKAEKPEKVHTEYFIARYKKGGTAHTVYTEHKRNQVKKLMIRGGGGHYLSRGAVTAMSNSILGNFFESLVKQTLIYTEHARRKVINLEDVKMAYQNQGVDYYGKGEDIEHCTPYEAHLKEGREKRATKSAEDECKSKATKPRKHKKGVVHRRKVEFYQKNSGCITLTISYVRKLLYHHAGKHFKDIDIKITKQAMYALISILENQIVKTTELASLIVLSTTKTKTISEEVVNLCVGKNFQNIINSMSTKYLTKL